MPGDDGTYVWANADELAERQRLESLEAWFDPLTQRHLEAIDIGVGWRCLEVSAGGGSIARWLAQRVGPSGSVVATDVDVRFLTELPATVEVRRHDVLSDALESEEFDVVHCRALLANLSDPRSALARLAAAVAPGGWLVVEEADTGLLTFSGFPGADRATSVMQDIDHRWAERGMTNVFYGRHVPGLVYELELDGFDTRCTTAIATIGHPAYDVAKLSWVLARQAAAAIGIDEDDLSCVDLAYEATTALMIAPAFFAAWGRRRTA